jgi:hypothetical protein
MFGLVQQYHSFRQSLARVVVADGGIADVPDGIVSSPGQYMVAGSTAYGPAGSCATDSPASIDCGPLSQWNEGYFKTT